MTATDTRALGTDDVAAVEAGQDRIQRLSTGGLLLVVGLLLVWAIFSSDGVARIALSDAFDAVQLPVVPLPGTVTVTICAVLVLAAAAAFLTNKGAGRVRRILGILAGIAVVLGFIT